MEKLSNNFHFCTFWYFHYCTFWYFHCCTFWYFSKNKHELNVQKLVSFNFFLRLLNVMLCYVMLVTQLIYFLAQSSCKKKLRNCSVWLPLNCGEREKALFERKNIKNNLINECVLQGWHIALPCVEWCS